MACPEDHPDDKHGKEYCRAWCPTHKFIWAKWHYTMIVDERCVCAGEPPQAIVLVRKPSHLSALAQFARLKLRRLRMRFRVYRWMYMAAVKHVIEASIYQYLLDVLSQDRHDD